MTTPNVFQSLVSIGYWAALAFAGIFALWQMRAREKAERQLKTSVENNRDLLAKSAPDATQNAALNKAIADLDKYGDRFQELLKTHSDLADTANAAQTRLRDMDAFIRSANLQGEFENFQRIALQRPKP